MPVQRLNCKNSPLIKAIVTTIQATPFVPGRVQGILRFGPQVTARNEIVVIQQAEIARLGVSPAGIVLTGAAPFSHPVLRLLSRGIPTVLMEEAQLAGLQEGVEVLLDGNLGLLAWPVPPDPPDLVQPAFPEAGKPVHTKDGMPVELCASVGNVPGAATARERGAASIGLVRSEYLFPENGRKPDAGYLADMFRKVCEAADPLTVTFRLIDIASDKRPPWLGNIPGIAGVLGLQGARLYAIEPVRQVYLAELEALSRLSADYRFKVLLPYIVSLEELEILAAEVRHHLPETIPVGAMLETPAAAMAVHEFLEVVNFAALGCNDLMQCLFAADRDLPELRDWLNPHSPILYRFLEQVAHRAGAACKTIQVCGLLSQLPGLLPVLLGLGYRSYSVDPVMLPWLARSVRQTDIAEAVQLARAICDSRHSVEVRKLLVPAC